DAGFRREQYETAAHLREKVLAFAHRAGDQPLEQLSHARLHNRESDPPHARAHDVEPDDARYQPVHVARTGYLHRFFARRPRVGPPRRVLERLVNEQPRDAALVARRIESIRRRTGRDDEKVNFAFTQRTGLAARRHLTDGHAWRVFERFPNPVRSIPRFDANNCGPAATAGKCNRERYRYQNREDERPEDCFRFAGEFAEPCERQLDQRVPRSAAVEGRIHSSRRCLPVSATNTSSSVPWCVITRGAPSVAISSRGEPSAITFPRSTIATRSHSVSASSM